MGGRSSIVTAEMPGKIENALRENRRLTVDELSLLPRILIQYLEIPFCIWSFSNDKVVKGDGGVLEPVGGNYFEEGIKKWIKSNGDYYTSLHYVLRYHVIFYFEFKTFNF